MKKIGIAMLVGFSLSLIMQVALAKPIQTHESLENNITVRVEQVLRPTSVSGLIEKVHLKEDLDIPQMPCWQDQKFWEELLIELREQEKLLKDFKQA
jgi:hypothetical protein